MKTRFPLPVILMAVPVAACLLAVGCGKKEEQAAPTPPPAAETEPQQPQAAAPQAPAAPAVSPAMLAEQQAAAQRLREAEAAARAREYERAVQAMIQLQQQRRIWSEQQAALYQQQMQRLQADLATAAANGDPRAKAAIDRLRASATVR